MKKILYIILMCLTPVIAMAQNEGEQKIIQKISKAAQSMASMQCDFVQTKHMKLLNDNMVSYGKMYYQQSSKLRWEYTSPYTYTFILNDSKVLLKKGNRNDVIDVNQNKMFKEIARMMMNSVVGKCLTDKKDFKISVAETPEQYVATLLPQKKDMKQMFSKIILYVNKRQLTIAKVEMQEKKGDNTVIELKNIQLNKNINASTFAIN
ncbi:MAG: outer membrane lipoprotein carrier protein LolA [Bacteroidaceae bacterium]|nr:outer membrane lipoprotein carrier protein LolA [Bacteroidaceae bacterium]